MNIYQKLTCMRAKSHQMGIKKTGHNKYEGYRYFQLEDIANPLDHLCSELGLAHVYHSELDTATLTLVNVDDPSEKIDFTMHALQSFKNEESNKSDNVDNRQKNLQKTETSNKRHLYSTLLNLNEGDWKQLEEEDEEEASNIPIEKVKTPEDVPMPTDHDVELNPWQKDTLIRRSRLLEKIIEACERRGAVITLNSIQNELERKFDKNHIQKGVYNRGLKDLGVLEHSI